MAENKRFFRPEATASIKQWTLLVAKWVLTALLGTLILGGSVLMVVSSQRLYRDWDALQQQSKDPKQKFDASLELSKSVVGGIGTLATIAGGIVLYLNFRVGNRNAQIAADNLKVSEEKQVTERFAKAVEQLGSDKVEIRLGAIYALERIAKDSRRDHWTIMEILCAYIRERSPVKPTKSTVVSPKKSLVESYLAETPHNKGVDNEVDKPAVDIQAALTVIGRRRIEFDPDIEVLGLHLTPEFDLSHTDLRGADISNGNFGKAIFVGSNLVGAEFLNTYLKDASFYRAELSNAFLFGANLTNAEFESAMLSGANLSIANLRGANLTDASFINTILWVADLSDTKGWTDEQLGQAKLCQTKLPEGSKLDPNRDCSKPSPASDLTTSEATDVSTFEGKGEGEVGEN